MVLSTESMEKGALEHVNTLRAVVNALPLVAFVVDQIRCASTGLCVSSSSLRAASHPSNK